VDNHYLKEISSYTILPSEEQIKLCVRAQHGDILSRDRLVKSNVRFVVNIAKQYQHQGLDLEDIISEGNIGLIRAIDKFDPAKGNKFITYAGWWVRQAILQALNEHAKSVRVPLNRTVVLRRYMKEQETMQQKLQRHASDQEILDSLNLEGTDITYNSDFSIDAPIYDDVVTLDILADTNIEPPDSQVMRNSQKLEIKLILAFLSEREQDILKLYYGIDYERTHTLEEISDKFKLTRERIRQIKKMALKKLRRLYKRKKFNGII
jgi:RNA polymerase primary sigma factor